MDVVLDLTEIVAVVVAIFGLLTGRKRLEWSRRLSALMWFVDLLILAVAVLRLGWLGLAIVIVAHVLWFVASAVRLAMRRESILVYAATLADTGKEEMNNLDRDLARRHRAWKSISPLPRAQLLCELAQRGRDLDEICQMAIPVALLWVAHPHSDGERMSLSELAEKFDRLLRLYGESASRSMRVADTLTASAKHSAATFEEMLDATIAVVSPVGD